MVVEDWVETAAVAAAAAAVAVEQLSETGDAKCAP